MSEDYEVVRPKVPIPIGNVRDTVSKESSGLKTVMRMHDKGVSVTQYRRTFQHNGQVEIPGTSQWHPVRHQEWLTAPSYDWLHESLQEPVITERIKGDPDE